MRDEDAMRKISLKTRELPREDRTVPPWDV